MSKTLKGAAASAAVALALGVAAPASALAMTVEDPVESGHGVDLHAVRVGNGEKNLRVVLTHTNLRRDPGTGSGGVVYIDTDPTDKGPEFAFVGGFFEGTDYQLVATEGFGAKNWGDAVDGSYRMILDYRQEQTRIRIAQDALGDVGELRVAVRVAGRRTDGSKVVDWLGEPRSFTGWVDRG
jgi:hypothetical protein